MPVTFSDNDVDWFRTTLGSKLRAYSGGEPAPQIAHRIAREMLQSITDRVAQREAYEASLAAQEQAAPA